MQRSLEILVLRFPVKSHTVEGRAQVFGISISCLTHSLVKEIEPILPWVAKK